MNICIITAKVITAPKLLRFKSTALSQMILCVPNDKKGLLHYKIKAIAKGQLAKDIFEIYRKNNFIIVEGFIYLKKIEKRHINEMNKFRNQKSIIIKITKIHPASLI
uniref:Putative single-stranded DNA binding protein n=1 Tax=Sebdenia flabellata TaxID=42024 RepID=A0A1C9C9V1_9FLOR|nr:putative single-stranded DNA binding protein [Sebdenia flabellata]AOM65139.1 putative single-stranded DNA binding protein [Sebdenia flabellata]